MSEIRPLEVQNSGLDLLRAYLVAAARFFTRGASLLLHLGTGVFLVLVTDGGDL
jgi:branched-subunit amino acid transport protein AzlD